MTLVGLPQKVSESWVQKSLCNRDPKKDIEIRRRIRRVLLDLRESLLGTGAQQCWNFRELTRDCPLSGYEPWHIPKTKEKRWETMRDAEEFLRYLLEVFE